MKCERCKVNEATARRVDTPPYPFICLECLTDAEWHTVYLVPKTVDITDLDALRAARDECREAVERMGLEGFSLLSNREAIEGGKL